MKFGLLERLILRNLGMQSDLENQEPYHYKTNWVRGLPRRIGNFYEAMMDAPLGPNRYAVVRKRKVWSQSSFFRNIKNATEGVVGS